MQGYRDPYELETVSAKITEPAGENSKVSIWQQYFDGVYYGVILADTVVRVWGIARETRRDYRRKEKTNRPYAFRITG